MRTLVKTVYAITALAMAAACAKVGGAVSSADGTDACEGSRIDVEIQGVMGGYVSDDTKAVAENVVRIMWKGGEKVYVYDGVKKIGCLAASVEGTDSTYAKLSGTITAPSGSKPITLVYSPQFDSEPYLVNNQISLGLTTQDEEEVPFLIYGTLPPTTAEKIVDVVVNFSLATSVYKCNCACLPDDEVSLAEIGTTNTVCVMTLSDSAEPVITGTYPGRIKRGGGFTRTDGGTIFSVCLPPASKTEVRTIEVMTKGGKSYGAAFSKTAFEPAKAYNALFMLKSFSGTFSVADDRRVYFAKGNLWYDGTKEPSGPRFKIEDNQYDYKVGSYHPVSSPYWDWDENHVSHFYWSSKSYEACKQTYDDKGCSAADIFFTNEDATTANSDFTVVVDGEAQNGVWRILSGGNDGEWNYLLSQRDKMGKMKFNKRCYTFAVEKGIKIEDKTYKGLFIYPDDYNGEEVGDNKFTWAQIDSSDIVFLPAVGFRSGNQVYYVEGGYGTCWSSIPYDAENAYSLNFAFGYPPSLNPSNSISRSYAVTVRLVRDVKY